MCGIAGAWDFAGDYGFDSLRGLGGQMTAALAHRGPDGAGLWVDRENGIVIGHRRLALIDLSDTGHQPMVSQCGRYAISFNGEIYNYRQVRNELAGMGTRFRGTSDTEVLVEAIGRWDLEPALQKIDGMYAFAVWDRIEKRLRLVRDRFGEKPLYYAADDRRILFASEIKALWAGSPAVGASIDAHALSLYFQFGYIPGAGTIFKPVRKVPPGSVVTVNSTGETSCRPYWSAAEAIVKARASRRRSLSIHAAAEELDGLMRESVRSRLVADVPVGVFLSGGLDSSLIAMQMAQLASASIQAFTISFGESQWDESPKAALVARLAGAEHRCLRLTANELISTIPAMSGVYDEPFADAAQVPTFLLSKFAREKVKAVLTGDGGDELFGGYRTYINARRFLTPARKYGRVLSPLLRAVLRLPLSADWRSRVELLSGAARRGSLPSLYAQLYTCPARVCDVAAESADVVPPLPQGLRTVEDALMYCDSLLYLPDNCLVKVDRASMAWGLEARVPMLNPDLFRFAWSLPPKLRVSYGSGKTLIRALLARLAPATIHAGPKQGFSLPLAEWLRGPLREWREDLLSEERLKREGWLDYHYVARLNSAFTAGSEVLNELWPVLMFENWLAHAGAASGKREAAAEACTPG